MRWDGDAGEHKQEVGRSFEFSKSSSTKAVPPPKQLHQLGIKYLKSWAYRGAFLIQKHHSHQLQV